jgi:dCMP deaminase
MTRLGWHDYFIEIAKAVALRSDCTRRKVGAVVVRDHRIIATGYNGSPPGGGSCEQGDCPRSVSGVEPGSSYDTGPGSCIAVHGEANAVIYAGRAGCKDAILYLTHEPCEGCKKLIEAAGIQEVVYDIPNPTKEEVPVEATEPIRSCGGRQPKKSAPAGSDWAACQVRPPGARIAAEVRKTQGLPPLGRGGTTYLASC